MAKLISLLGLSGEVATVAGPITFVDGVAEVPDDVAAELQVSDIRVEYGEPAQEEPAQDEQPKEEPAQDEQPKEEATITKAPVKVPAKRK